MPFFFARPLFSCLLGFLFSASRFEFGGQEEGEDEVELSFPFSPSRAEIGEADELELEELELEELELEELEEEEESFSLLVVAFG